MTSFLQRLQVTKIPSRFLQATILLFLIIATPLFSDVYSVWGELLDVYHIKKGDTLLIAVIGQPDYTHSVQVRDDGRISYFGGDLQVAGKTTEQVNIAIREYLLNKNLVNNPVIMVSVISHENSVYVGGAVTTPGRYIITPESDIDLYRAIALAGGMTENADVEQVQLIRFNIIKRLSETTKSDEPTEVKSMELVETYNLSTDQRYRDIRVNAKDLVYVKPLSVIEVQGQVKSAGKLFIRDKISLANALARAGGTTEEADLTALVKIDKDGSLTEFSVTEQFWKTINQNEKDIYLSDGDVLFVPNAFKIEPIYVTGYVRTPGAQRVRGPLTLQKAIALAGGLEDDANREKFHIHHKDGTTTEHIFKPGTDTIILYPGDILEIQKRFQLNWGLISTITTTTIAVTSFIISLRSN